MGTALALNHLVKRANTFQGNRIMEMGWILKFFLLEKVKNLYLEHSSSQLYFNFVKKNTLFYNNNDILLDAIWLNS